MIAGRINILDTPSSVGSVELSRCVASDSGVSNLRCVVLPHLVRPHEDLAGKSEVETNLIISYLKYLPFPIFYGRR
jgi:hypothetical protein